MGGDRLSFSPSNPILPLALNRPIGHCSEVLEISVASRLVLDDPSAAVAACVAGQGVFLALEMGLGPWLGSGELVQILPDWSEERFPLYAYHPSRHLPPAKVRLRPLD